MTEIPYNVEYAVFDIETRTPGLPFGYIEAGHLRRIRQRRMRLNFLMHRAQDSVINLQAHGVHLRLIIKQGRRC